MHESSRVESSQTCYCLCLLNRKACLSLFDVVIESSSNGLLVIGRARLDVVYI